ncbi:hypothetical protein FQN54_005390 [Arachnomyces sp. PD_36]|nr:hypothetical protein FQN54_005390 [Arachnomyces sp. PD_36]
MIFFRQVWTLIVKNLLITLVRPLFTTTIRAFLLPVVFIAFISFARNLFIPPSQFGISDPYPIRSFSTALEDATGGRNKVAFVNNGFHGGDIERVIDKLSEPVKATGKKVEILSSPEALRDICQNTLMGVSTCVGAAVFYSSPDEGPDGTWNYSIRADGALGTTIDVNDNNNDAQLYSLPLQRAVDFAIASINGTINQDALPQEVMEYPFTSETAEEREDRIRNRYMGTIVNVLAVGIYIGLVLVTYQLTGLVASEREMGMSQLIDCMMPSSSPWKPQAARLLAAHLALDIIYLPGWIVMGFVLKFGLFTNTSAGILVVFYIISGLSMSSFSLFGASLFKKAQLSGITVVIVCLLLGILAQVTGKSSTGTIIVLSLLFPPMNCVYFHMFLARWEAQNLPTNLVKAAPENPWTCPGIALWILCIVQILVFPVLAALIERGLYGTASKSRKSTSNEGASAVSLNGFTKVYAPNWYYRTIAPIFGSRRQTVVAVDNLSLEAVKGQIMVLLGANGSGKSTTLDAVSGLSKITSGEISVNFPEGSGGFGLCPQKNVLWDKLTVKEHIKIFRGLKAGRGPKTNDQLSDLIEACDLDKKTNSYSKTLSGGQKRKLQLAMMFIGGSSICCVDEVSSGLDPISRRKIWDILLAERGSRTIILTTHFLDEADLLADHIAILSKGNLRASGSSVELKHKLGSGYRVHVFNVPGAERSHIPEFENISKEAHHDETVYHVPDSAQAARFVARLEQSGITEYSVSGPTIEEVFLKVADEASSESPESRDGDAFGQTMGNKSAAYSAPQLLTGKRIGMASQAWILFRKRITILRRNYLPYAAALIIPIIAAGLVTLFLTDFDMGDCSGERAFSVDDAPVLPDDFKFDLVLGPSNKLDFATLSNYMGSFMESAGMPAQTGMSELAQNVNIVDTLDEFNDYISNNFHNVTPGGFFLGDDNSPPTLAWLGDGDISMVSLIQNAMDNLLTNVSITTRYQRFDIPWQQDMGSALQLIVYFGLAMSVYPAFFALYPTVERLRNIRSLHFSNGVRSFPLWLAYAMFDFLVVLATSVVAIVIFAAVTSSFYHLEYLFVVFFLYGLASTLLSYIISLFSTSQLAAFAFAAGGQAIMFLIYLIAYMVVVTYAPTDKVNSYINVAHFAISAVSPVGSLTRSMFTVMNVFSILCRDKQIISYPGEIVLYGGPIVYLIVQIIILFGILLWSDSGPLSSKIRSSIKSEDIEEKDGLDPEVRDELTRVASSNDGLRVVHLSKTFKKNVAVQDVSFGVGRGEVFALLGPNGAGKSTTISLIRGDISPSRRGGEIFVENISVSKDRATARSHLGVCPQFDAMDQMTVLEHLNFYARIRGVSDVQHNVDQVIRAVGLTSFRHRMAAKLSGGNKRKLSLGIALMGNPTVLLLDEPSSGMDAASKRVMWRTLASVVPGRSLVLTTHSMEEADALANRAGIMARKMLALGTTDYLRAKHGNMYHVHLVHVDSPHTSEYDMERIRNWVATALPGAVVEQKTYHGQLRFSIPANFSLMPSSSHSDDVISEPDCHAMTSDGAVTPVKSAGGISALFSLLEENKRDLGFHYYSVSQTTLDQVFLTIVGKHHVEEEG